LTEAASRTPVRIIYPARIGAPGGANRERKRAEYAHSRRCPSPRSELCAKDERYCPPRL